MINNFELIKPLTIRELIDKLNLVITEFDVSEDDYVFFTPVGADEGNLNALTPVHNICGNTLKCYDFNKNLIEKIMENDGVNLSFVSNKLINY